MKISAASVAGALLKYIIPPVVTVGLCWMLFRNIDLSEMLWVVSRDCAVGWLLGSLALNIAAQVARAVRWRIQLKALGVNPSLWLTTLSIFGTYAVNLIFPRLGELWRTGFIAKRQDAPFSSIFGSMVADRLTDTICVGLLTLLASLLAGPQVKAYLMQDPDRWQRIMAIAGSPWLWAAIAACVAGGILILIRTRHRGGLAGHVRKFVAGLWEGFAVIRTMPGRGRWLLMTILIWGAYFFGLGCALLAFPLTAEVLVHGGLTALLVCFVLSSLSMAVPSNGGIGPYQWALMWALSLYASSVDGLTRTYTAIVANTIMGASTIMLILLGILTFGWIAFNPSSKSKK